MPRKEKMVSRTVEMTDVRVMCVELDSAEVYNDTVSLEGDWEGKPHRAILNAVEDTLISLDPEIRVKPVEVLKIEAVTVKVTMPLSTFIDNATETIKIEDTKEEI